MNLKVEAEHVKQWERGEWNVMFSDLAMSARRSYM